jgi:hypothetical protein
MWFPKTQLLKKEPFKKLNSLKIPDDHPGFQLIVTRSEAHTEYSKTIQSKQHFFKHVQVEDIAGDYTLFEVKVKKPVLNLACNLVQL